jgi:hypothetical protein
VIRVLLTDGEYTAATDALRVYGPYDQRDWPYITKIKAKLGEANESKPVRFTNKEANVLMDATEKRIAKVRPEEFSIPDLTLDDCILAVLDEYGERLKRGGASPTTTLVTLAVTANWVRNHLGPEVVADGVVVEVRRVGTRLRALERKGHVHRVKIEGQREARWWHIAHWNARLERDRQRQAETEKRNAETGAVRERWAATGYPIKDVDGVTGEVTLDGQTAALVVEVIEATLALTNAAREARGEEAL